MLFAGVSDVVVCRRLICGLQEVELLLFARG